MMRLSKKHYKFNMILLLCIGLSFLVTAGSAKTGITLDVRYSKGLLTLKADKAPLLDILKAISEAAAIDVLISKDFVSVDLSIQVAGEPLEEAVRRILRGYNYAAIYEKEGDNFRIAALKIYPEGQASGVVVPLFSGGRTPHYEEKNRRGETVTVLVNAGGEIITRGSAAARRGSVCPSQTELTSEVSPGAGLDSPWFALQLQQEQEEAMRFADLLMLRRQMELVTEQEKQQAMALVYADEVAKFQAFKKANMNKVESLKRINRFQEVTK